MQVSAARIQRNIAICMRAMAAFCLFFNCIPDGNRNLGLAMPFYCCRIVSQSKTDRVQNSTSLESAIESALADGRNSNAETMLATLLRQTQLDPDLLLKAGASFAQNGLYRDAAIAFERCLEDHPEIFEAHYDLALSEFAQQRYTKAIAILRAARPQNKRQRLALSYMRGKVEDALGYSQEAGKDLTVAFFGDPKNEDYALDLGLYYIRQTGYIQATKVLAKSITYHPDSPFVALGLGLAQYLAGQTQDCLHTCRQFLSNHPDFTLIRALLSFTLYMHGSFAAAEAASKQGLGSSHPYPYLYYLHVAALLKLQSRDIGRMLDEIHTAEEQIRNCSLCYFAESEINERRGSNEAAVGDLKASIRMDPAFSGAWYRLAILYDKTGRHEMAAQARTRFETLKTRKSQTENAILQGEFVRALSLAETGAVH